MTYEIHQPKINAEMPKNLRNKSAMEIVEYLQDHFNTEEIIVNGNFAGMKATNKATAYMMAVSSAIFDPADWKAPCKVWFAECGEEWVKAAIIWYHGATPRSNPHYWVYSSGYAC